jgi:predicted GNAT family acetyltransferase
MTDALDIVDDERSHRFVARADGHEAELVYRRDGNRLVVEHTEVPEELGGRGLGGKLVAAAIEDARARGLAVEVECPFARDWIERHPDRVAGVVVVLTGDGAQHDGGA